MNILLLGHKGYLGSFLKEKLLVDIAPANIHYDYIINCIGKPNLEFCEENPTTSFVSNYEVVLDIIEKYPQSKIIHFSSYYVYDDTGECTEASKTTSEYKYCEHKLLSEEAVVKNNGVTFRVGKLFGHTDIQKQNKLTELLLTAKEIVLDDVMFNPTSLSQVLKVIQYELQNNNLSGVHNLANDGHASHYEYGKFIQEHFNPKLKITRIEKNKRSFHNYGNFLMSCEKLRKCVLLTKWEDDMLQYLKEIRCIA